MMKFIYVFTDVDRDKLLKSGFKLINEDRKEHFYVFIYPDKINFSAYSDENSITEYVCRDTIGL